MTQEAKATKNYFQLSGGLNTEATEIGFPDGYTTDEANYELLPDGSRRRRKGLRAESGQSTALTTTTFTTSCRQQSYIWKNVGGDPTKTTLVYKQGAVLYFADADETISDGWSSDFISLGAYASADATTANLDDGPVSFAQGRGRLLVTGKYVLPFYVEWDGTNYVGNSIRLLIRDFTDVDDGTNVDWKPPALSAAHEYNLRNRGWPASKITASYGGNYPSRNMVWWKGFERKTDESTVAAVEKIGKRVFSTSKLLDEGFGTSSAPKGALFLSPFGTDFGYQIGTASSSGTCNITDWFISGGTASNPWEVVVTVDTDIGLNLTGGDTIVIDGQLSGWYWAVTGYGGGGGGYGVSTILDGTHVTDSATGFGTGAPYTFTITVSKPANFGSFGGVGQYYQYGQVSTDGALPRDTGTAFGDSLASVEFYAGRAFYAGFSNEEWADHIFFSQIVDSPNKLGRCYQDNDPTDENYNAITPTDGGDIIVPGLAGVIELRKLRDSLLIFSTEGVWELAGQRGSVFLPDRYSVRQLTNLGCSSPDSIVEVQNTIIYTGPAGIVNIAPNQYTGLLEAQNMIVQTIQTKWNEYTTAEQEHCQAFYDDAKNRVYFLLGPDGTSIAVTEMLILDLKWGAWTRYTFDAPTNNVLLTGFALPTADDPTTNKKAKFLYEATTSTVNVADFAQTSFNDWDGTNGPLPYMYTGWDNLGDFQRRRQAPVVTVFSKRTETGYTSAGSPVQYTAVNDSSTKMKALWDWAADNSSYPGDTDEATTGKVGALQQVYRHARNFSPSATTDLDGYPVVTTRNKVRGRGRVLQLMFIGEADKDSHLLGFTTNYKVSRRI